MANIKIGVTGKESRPNFPRKEHFYPLIRTRGNQGARNVRFSENLACFCLINDEFQFRYEKGTIYLCVIFRVMFTRRIEV